MKPGKHEDASRALLSFWTPPQDAGEARGVLATTFTFDAALFEEECLSRFIDVQSDPRRDGALFRLEREGKLADLIAAAVVADIHHCHGERSLRWDLLAARPKRGILHAKVSLLAWRNHVRVLVGSANLTEPGYRQNQECMAILDFTPEQGDQGLLAPLLAFLREVLALAEGPGRQRAEALLDWVRRRIPVSAAPARGLQRRWLFTGPGRPDAFSQLRGLAPRAVWDRAQVVSPFFDEKHGTTGPAAGLWKTLKQRGAAAVDFHVPGEELEKPGRWRLAAPKHLAKAQPAARPGATLAFHPVRVRAVATAGGPENRDLHAKMLLLAGPAQVLLSVGSGNFTSAGMGLSSAKNMEAHLIYLLAAPENDPTRRALERRLLSGGTALTLNRDIEFTPAEDGEGEAGEVAAPLPEFFKVALLLESPDNRWRLQLDFAEQPPQGWQVYLEKNALLNKASWLKAGSPASRVCEAPRLGGIPSELHVEWQDAQGQAHVAAWPLAAATPEALPPPPELNGLSLATLLDLLASGKPLHTALRSLLKNPPDDDTAEPVLELIDPHAKVDTRDFLVQRVRRACWAMREIRDRLEQPVASLAGLVWRLQGPVGVKAVLAAMEKECDSKLPDEKAFLLCEMVRELRSVQLTDPEGQPHQSELAQRYTAFLTELTQRARKATRIASPAMKKYIQEALES